MSRSRRRPPAGLDAYRRHGGVHQDQYRTAKQSRRDAAAEADAALAEQRDEDMEFVRHAMGIGPEFEGPEDRWPFAADPEV